jgi:hypothetical protein
MSTIKLWLAGAAAAIGAVVLAFVYALGRRGAQHEQLRQRMEGVDARAEADRVAASDSDPVSRLREGGWVRDVAPDNREQR